MIYSLIILIQFVNIMMSLECRQAWPSNCIYNSTCQYNIIKCESELNTRGGRYCSTIIQKKDQEILIGQMDCIYDQETTKTCKNQTECLLKYTNAQKQFLHCCCDTNFCNFNFTLPDPDLPIIPIKSENSCQNLLCKSIIPISICLTIVLIILLIIISIIYRKKFYKCFEKCGGVIDKSSSKIQSDEIDENGPLLINNQQNITFNQLFIGNLVKKGRFSSIHQGTYENKSVAIKMLFDQQDSNNESRILFEHEKKIYSQPFMTHINILKYYGYSEWNGKLCIITELSENGSLRDVLRSRLLKDEKELILILKQISEGIQYLHNDYRNRDGITRPPIAHRDFKSENILYLNSNQLVICDFAMSTIIEQNQNSPNQEQQIGTPRYMSPEILAATIGSEKDALLKCDVYALGIVFWEVLSRYKFENKDNNQIYSQPFEKQLIENNLNVNNPTVNDMLIIMYLSNISDRRPLINPLWKYSNIQWLNSIYSTMEDCWEQSPEARISSGVVASRIQQITISN